MLTRRQILIGSAAAAALPVVAKAQDGLTSSPYAAYFQTIEPTKVLVHKHVHRRTFVTTEMQNVRHQYGVNLPASPYATVMTGRDLSVAVTGTIVTLPDPPATESGTKHILIRSHWSAANFADVKAPQDVRLGDRNEVIPVIETSTGVAGSVPTFFTMRPGSIWKIVAEQTASTADPTAGFPLYPHRPVDLIHVMLEQRESSQHPTPESVPG